MELKTRHDAQNHTALALKSTFTSPMPIFAPGLMELFCRKTQPLAVHIYQTIQGIVLTWLIFHQRQEFEFEKFCLAELVI